MLVHSPVALRGRPPRLMTQERLLGVSLAHLWRRLVRPRYLLESDIYVIDHLPVSAALLAAVIYLVRKYCTSLRRATGGGPVRIPPPALRDRPMAGTVIMTPGAYERYMPSSPQYPPTAVRTGPHYLPNLHPIVPGMAAPPVPSAPIQPSPL